MAIKRIAGPAYLANSATNIYTPPNAAVITIINQISLCNVTAGAITVSVYIGATGGSAGGTELFKDYSIAANSVYDRYFSPGIPMASSDFLSGLASAATSVTVTVSGSYQAA